MLHVGQVRGVLRVGDAVTAQLEARRRDRIMSNHTMTHVLNFGLREVPAACPPPFMSSPNPLWPPALCSGASGFAGRGRTLPAVCEVVMGVSTSACAGTPLRA